MWSRMKTSAKDHYVVSSSHADHICVYVLCYMLNMLKHTPSWSLHDDYLASVTCRKLFSAPWRALTSGLHHSSVNREMCHSNPPHRRKRRSWAWTTTSCWRRTLKQGTKRRRTRSWTRRRRRKRRRKRRRRRRAPRIKYCGSWQRSHPKWRRLSGTWSPLLGRWWSPSCWAWQVRCFACCAVNLYPDRIPLHLMISAIYGSCAPSSQGAFEL